MMFPSSHSSKPPTAMTASPHTLKHSDGPAIGWSHVHPHSISHDALHPSPATALPSSAKSHHYEQIMRLISCSRNKKAQSMVSCMNGNLAFFAPKLGGQIWKGGGRAISEKIFALRLCLVRRERSCAVLLHGRTHAFRMRRNSGIELFGMQLACMLLLINTGRANYGVIYSHSETLNATQKH
jgi:hypothetical protein